jgi:hypothetical protein
MYIDGYVIVEPGGDRPYFCLAYPASYLATGAKPGAKVFSFRLDVPGFEKIQGVIQLTPTDIVELTERKMAPDVVEQMEFTCPKCGSHFFGTSQTRAEGTIRSCHGTTCTFSFNALDDHLYFKGTGHFSPRTVVATGPILGDP